MSSATNNGSIASYPISGNGFTLTNFGTIGTVAGSAVTASGSNDTVVNTGTIRGTTFGITASLGISVGNSGIGAAIYGGTAGIDVTGAAATITNAASIGGFNYGIYLKAGGTVANQSGGTISAGEGVVLIHGGALTNEAGGTIRGNAAIRGYGGSTVVNYGGVIASIAAAFHQGADLGQNSLLINHAGGSIAGYFGVATDGASTVVNDGTIVGGVGFGGKGVQLFAGGTLTNEAGGTISSGGSGVWGISSAAVAVVNAGSIFGGNAGVYLSQGFLTNQTNGMISGGAVLADGATLLNAGKIGSTFYGVSLTGGSALTNQSGGTISGTSEGVHVAGGSFVTNQSGGTIGGNIGAEVYTAGTVNNAGSIAGTGTGVDLLLGGTLVNQAGGTITGGAGTGVGLFGIADLYYDSYTGNTYVEGYRTGRGAITNAGLISGHYGIQVRNSFATVTNSGTIAGTAYAIMFANGYASRLVLDPGASILGSVAGASGILELASAASAGTLNSLGSQISGFSQVYVDAGATWVVNGSDTLIAGSTLTNAGTLDGIGGVAVQFAAGAGNRLVVDPGAVFIGTIDGGNTLGSTNSSVLELAAGTAPGPSTLSGLGSQVVDFSRILVDAGAYWEFNPDLIGEGVTLVIAGTIGGSAVFGAGAPNRVVVDPGAVFLGTLDGGNTIGSTVVSTLELGGGASTGTLNGLGSAVIDFGEIAVDAGANWNLSSAGFAAGTTLVNAGTVSGAAVVFGAGAGNRVVIDQGGTFSAIVNGGNALGSGTVSVLELAAGGPYGALSGIGTQFTNFAQITVDAGAYWTLQNTNTIASGATLAVSGALTNAGTLLGNVTLAGGTILNTVGGTIAGAVIAASGNAIVSNAGTITGAVSLAGGYANAVVVYPDAVFGGAVNGNGVSSVLDLDAAGATVGTLTGFGTKYAGFTGLSIQPHAYWNLGGTLPAGTVLTDAGTAEGSPDAVRFAAGAGNLLVVRAGGTFSGIVDGGNALGSGNGSTLELASPEGGFADGTLSGLGSTIIDFATVYVDPGAYWQTVNTNTIAAAATFSVSGYLGNYGTLLGNLTLAAGGTLHNNDLFDGAVIGTASGITLKNFGTVLSSGAASVSFNNGGSVYNKLNISGAGYGIRVSGGAGHVQNYGSIAGTPAGVALLDGGALINGENGLVTGASGVILGSAGGSVANYGRIAGGAGGSGVVLQAGGYILNQFGGTISGANGVMQQAAGAATLLNSGTISGTGNSVLLHAGAANRVVIYQGAVFHGVVDGGNPIGGAAVSTLELTSGSGTGTLSGLGSQYVNFAQITVDHGAYWSLTGSNTIVSGTTLSLDAATVTAAGTLANNGAIMLGPSEMTVAGLTGSGSATMSDGLLEVQGTVGSGETIVFTGSDGELVFDAPAGVAGSVTQLSAGNYIDLIGVDPASVTFSSGRLDFTGGSFPLSFAAGSVFKPAISDGAGGAELSAICFCTGASIATPSGEVPVEQLAAGDNVLTASGAIRRIVWVGVGRVLAARGRRCAATPVIVRKGALANNVPHRDLRVTKGHSFLLDGVLIPVEFLVNHRSILWDDRAQEVTIHHVELATHDVLLANGAPAESYRDDGNRWLFQNANSGWALPPKTPYAPVLTGGPVVDAAWRRLVDRAGPRPGLPLTDDPDLHLSVDGRRLDPARRLGDAYVFRLPDMPHSVRLVSRAAAPQELGLARDPRILGVALRRVVARQAARLLVIEPDDVALTEGFHPCETDAHSPARFRWTDGDALLPASLVRGFAGAFDLTVHVAATVQYVADAAVYRAA